MRIENKAPVSPPPSDEPAGEPSFNDIARMALDRVEALERRCTALAVLVEEQAAQIKLLTDEAAREAAKAATLRDAVAAQAVVIARNAETAAHASDAFNAQISIIAETVNTNKTEASENAADLVQQFENHRIETATLISRLRDPLPKSLMIDHAGVLVAVDHTGDTREIGRVVGEPGREAPRIEAAKWKAGHIVLNMSDRTSHLIELPAMAGLEPVTPVAPVPAPARTREGDEVKAAVRMGIIMEAAAGVKSIAKIAKTYNLASAVVRAIIRDHENENAKRRKDPTAQ